jgi:hypothetical protein
MIQRRSSPVKGSVELPAGALAALGVVEEAGVLVSLFGGLEAVEGPVPLEGEGVLLGVLVVVLVLVLVVGVVTGGVWL